MNVQLFLLKQNHIFFQKKSFFLFFDYQKKKMTTEERSAGQSKKKKDDPPPPYDKHEAIFFLDKKISVMCCVVHSGPYIVRVVEHMIGDDGDDGDDVDDIRRVVRRTLCELLGLKPKSRKGGFSITIPAAANMLHLFEQAGVVAELPEDVPRPQQGWSEFTSHSKAASASEAESRRLQAWRDLWTRYSGWARHLVQHCSTSGSDVKKALAFSDLDIVRVGRFIVDPPPLGCCSCDLCVHVRKEKPTTSYLTTLLDAKEASFGHPLDTHAGPHTHIQARQVELRAGKGGLG